MIFEQLDVNNIYSIDEELKKYVSELFELVIKDKKSYNIAILDKIANDLLNGSFKIVVAKDVDDSYTQKDGLSGIDEREYIKSGKIQGRIIIFPAQMKKEKTEIMRTLSHEFEHYVCQSNENIAQNLDFLKERQFDNKKILEDIQSCELPEIGVFMGNLLNIEQGFDFYEEASTEIVSSELLKLKPKSYRNRISFLNSALLANGKSINELKIARRNGNFEFLKQIIPKEYFLNIPLLEKQLRKGLKDKNYEYVLKIKNDMDKVLFEYIDLLYNEKKLSSLPREIQGTIIDGIMETSIMGSDYKKAQYNKSKFSRELKGMASEEIVINKTKNEKNGQMIDYR